MYHTKRHEECCQHGFTCHKHLVVSNCTLLVSLCFVRQSTTIVVSWNFLYEHYQNWGWGKELFFSLGRCCSLRPAKTPPSVFSGQSILSLAMFLSPLITRRGLSGGNRGGATLSPMRPRRRREDELNLILSSTSNENVVASALPPQSSILPKIKSSNFTQKVSQSIVSCRILILLIF